MPTEESNQWDKFFSNLSNILTDIYESRRVLFANNFRHFLKDVSEEYVENQQPRWLDVIKQLRYLLYEPLEEKKSELHILGLDGKMLELKLLGFFESYSDYDENGGVKRLKESIKYAKIILGSLKSVFPIAELIKELLETIEMGIEKAEK